MDQSYQYPVTVTNEISYLCTVETVLEKKDIRAFSPEELKTVFERMGQPAYRATQVYEWLWKKSVSSFSEMTNLSRELRERLEEQFAIHAVQVSNSQQSNDGTIKSAFRLYDGNLVEGVLIPAEERMRSEEHTSELQSLMRSSYAVL